MSGLPPNLTFADVMRQANVVIECDADWEIACLLADRIRKGLKTGEWPASADLTGKLASLDDLVDRFDDVACKAMHDVELRKAYDFTGLPAPLAAQAQVTLAMMKRAETPAELCRANQEAERLKADLDTFAALKIATDPRLGKFYGPGWRA